MITTIPLGVVKKCISLNSKDERITAIKYLRHETGLGLREAKELVESEFHLDKMNEYDCIISHDVTTKINDKPPPEIARHLDAIYQHTQQIAAHHNELERLGFRVEAKP